MDETLQQLDALKKKFVNLPSAMPSMMREVVLESKDQVEALNTDQLDRGERPDGSILPNYSMRSITEFGKPPGPMRMYDLGFFWGGITLVTSEEGFDLVGLDDKTQMLELRYGDLVGLQEESKQTIEDDIFKPELPSRISVYMEF